jgi:isopentenyl phosphate kinase
MMITLVKIGGSVLTDKQRPLVFQEEYARQVAADIRLSGTVPVIVHGTGSWAKAVGRHFRTEGGWARDATGFQMTALRIRRLQEALAAALRDEGVMCSPMQANALFHRTGGVLDLYGTGPLEHLVAAGVSPLLCGDVLVEGPGTFRVVSSDTVLLTLARRLEVGDCVLATDVDGVWDEDGTLLPEVARPAAAADDNDRRDVTGGMSAKVTAALDIAATGARTTIVNGRVRGRLRDALARRPVTGTRVLAPGARPPEPGGPGAAPGRQDRADQEDRPQDPEQPRAAALHPAGAQ